MNKSLKQFAVAGETAVEKSDLQAYAVEVYNGKHLLTVITVKAKDYDEASAKAREQFFRDINVKIKRSY